MKIFSPILKGTTTVSQGTTNLSGSFTGSLLGTAATASYADNFTVGGTLTAQTINVQIITSSIEFNTGSTRNGSLSTNTHQFTGSVLMSGSVGIGTNSPSDIFHISKTSTSNWDAYLENTNNTAGNGIRLIFRTVDSGVTALNAGGIRTVFNSRGASTVDNDIIISTRGADNIIVAKNNGNVGIGTTSPTAIVHALKSNATAPTSGTTPSGYALSVGTENGNNGGLWFSADFGGDQGIAGIAGSRVSNYETDLRFYTNNTNSARAFTERMRITSEGYLGVTVTSTTVSDGDLLGVISFVSKDSSTYSSGGITNIRSYATSTYNTGNVAGDLRFYVSNGLQNTTGTYLFGTEAMRISSAGNVGIGTASPSERLHIYGTGAGPEMRLEGTWGSHYMRAYNDNWNFLTNGGRVAIVMNNLGSVFNYQNTTTWQQTSDIRIKENINTIENALNVITSLNPVSFNYKQEFAEKNNWDDIMKLNNIGFIAQEFENVFPKYVYTKEYTLGDTPIEDFKSIDTGHLVPYLVKAIQELSSKNTSLEERLTALENN